MSYLARLNILIYNCLLIFLIIMIFFIYLLTHIVLNLFNYIYIKRFLFTFIIFLTIKIHQKILYNYFEEK
jgi:hypothetical protein